MNPDPIQAAPEAVEALKAHAPEAMPEHPQMRGAFAPVAAVAGGALLLGALARPALAVTPPLTYSNIPGTGDTKVLNYALALEALEADLYDQALKRLTTGGTNGLGKTIPGLGLSDSDPVVKYIRLFRQVEIDHRDFLINTLGNAAITNSALKGAQFDFGFDDNSKNSKLQVVSLVLTAEATGVAAYLGAIPLFATKTYLPVAGAIQGTEARHTAVITQIKNREFGGSDPVAPYYKTNHGIDAPKTPDTVLAAVSPFIILPANN